VRGPDPRASQSLLPPLSEIPHLRGKSMAYPPLFVKYFFSFYAPTGRSTIIHSESELLVATADTANGKEHYVGAVKQS